MASLHLDVPCLFAKKAKPSTMTSEYYHTDIHSFTKNTTSTVVIAKQFLNEDDHVLIIDDFLANGEASLGLHRLVQAANARTSGIGIVIEKSFQPGREKLESEGLEVLSLCQVSSLLGNKVKLVGE